MINFLQQYWPDILLTLITTGALAFCRYSYKKLNQYKDFLDQKDQLEIVSVIKEELKPLITNLQELQNQMKVIENNHNALVDALIKSYKFRLVQLCKTHLEQEYITPEQFEQLAEFYKLYRELGGNGQAQDYYERTKELPIKEEKENKGSF